MALKFTQLRQYTPVYGKERTQGRLVRSGNSGFTLTELLVASFLAMIVLALSLTSVISNRNLYKYDVVRTRLNQNLRSAMDIISMTTKQAGEALTASFPAILLVDGGSGPDELILRRNLHENEILNICQNLPAGSTGMTVLFSYDTTLAGCAYSTDLLPYLNVWVDYANERGGIARAFAFNRSTKEGEFFLYENAVDTGTQMYVDRANSSAWQYSYTGDGVSAAMYLLEQTHFRLNNGVLQIIQSDDTSNILNVVDGITNFQVTARLTDETTVSALTITDHWTEIKWLEVTLSGTDSFAQEPVSSSLTARLFPRNILSN